MTVLCALITAYLIVLGARAIMSWFPIRPGTPAATMPEQIPPAIKAERNARLLEVTTHVAQARSRRRLHQTVEVLVDGAAKRHAGELSGRTRCNRVVNFHGQGRVAAGDLARVHVTEVLPHSLRGVLASPEEFGVRSGGAPCPEEAVCS